MLKKLLIIIPVLLCTVNLHAEEEELPWRKNITMLIVPREPLPVQIAQDISLRYPVLLVCYQKTGSKLLIHAWNGKSWVGVSAEDYVNGTFFANRPQHAILIEKKDAPAPDVLIPNGVWCQKGNRITTTDPRILIHLLGRHFNFPYRYWMQFSKRYNYSLEKLNPELFNINWWQYRGEKTDPEFARKLTEFDLKRWHDLNIPVPEPIKPVHLEKEPVPLPKAETPAENPLPKKAEKSKKAAPVTPDKRLTEESIIKGLSSEAEKSVKTKAVPEIKEPETKETEIVAPLSPAESKPIKSPEKELLKSDLSETDQTISTESSDDIKKAILEISSEDITVGPSPAESPRKPAVTSEIPSEEKVMSALPEKSAPVKTEPATVPEPARQTIEKKDSTRNFPSEIRKDTGSNPAEKVIPATPVKDNENAASKVLQENLTTEDSRAAESSKPGITKPAEQATANYSEQEESPIQNIKDSTPSPVRKTEQINPAKENTEPTPITSKITLPEDSKPTESSQPVTLKPANQVTEKKQSMQAVLTKVEKETTAVPAAKTDLIDSAKESAVSDMIKNPAVNKDVISALPEEKSIPTKSSESTIMETARQNDRAEAAQGALLKFKTESASAPVQTSKPADLAKEMKRSGISEEKVFSAIPEEEPIAAKSSESTAPEPVDQVTGNDLTTQKTPEKTEIESASIPMQMIEPMDSVKETEDSDSELIQEEIIPALPEEPIIKNTEQSLETIKQTYTETGKIEAPLETGKEAVSTPAQIIRPTIAKETSESSNIIEKPVKSKIIPALPETTSDEVSKPENSVEKSTSEIYESLKTDPFSSEKLPQAKIIN